MTLQAIAPFLHVMGFAVITWSIMDGVRTYRRGYGGVVQQVVAGVGVGLLLILFPTLGPMWLSAMAPKPTAEKPTVAEPAKAPFDPTSGVPTQAITITIVAIMALALLIAVVYGGVMFTRSRRRKSAEVREVALRAAAEESARLDRVWAESAERHDRLREESMRHESDIDLVLSMPLINDLSEPKTMAFIEALAKATDLAHDNRPTSAEAVEAYAAATRAAERAWGVAWRHADRVRLSNFDPAERSTIKQVTKLMKRAEYETTPEARRSYYQRAVAMLDHLIEIPAPATEAIEARVVGVLANPNAVAFHPPAGNVDGFILSTLVRKAREKVLR